MLTLSEKISIVSKDFEVGRLEMLLKLEGILKRKKSYNSYKDLIDTAIFIGNNYGLSSKFDLQNTYDSIQEEIIKVFELKNAYKIIEGDIQ